MARGRLGNKLAADDRRRLLRVETWPLDLLVGTYVTEARSDGPVLAPPLGARHKWIILSIVLVGGLLAWGGSRLARSELFAGMLTVIEKIEADDRVSAATAMVGSNWSNLNGVSQTTTNYTVTVTMRVRPENYERTAKEIADTVLAADPRANSKDMLSITIRYGYDIGIARVSTEKRFSHSPAQWLDR
jgi:hypothetical protein